MCSKHAACSNLSLVLCRPYSVFRTSIRTAVADAFVTGTKARTAARDVLSRNVRCNHDGSVAMSRQLDSANNTGDVSQDAEESWPSYTADWSKRELLMSTCGGFWDHRLEGAKVVVTYVDTAASIHRSQRREMPTVLVVPSGVTDHIELKPLLDLMVKTGWRILIPDFVGMKIYSLKFA